MTDSKDDGHNTATWEGCHKLTIVHHSGIFQSVITTNRTYKHTPTENGASLDCAGAAKLTMNVCPFPSCSTAHIGATK